MGGRLGGGREGGGGERGWPRGRGREGGGRSRKMAELPSGRLSHSRGLHDPPGSPEPGRNWTARRGRRPRGWCAAE